MQLCGRQTAAAPRSGLTKLGDQKARNEAIRNIHAVFGEVLPQKPHGYCVFTGKTL
jgi:hypothetical protein